MNKTRQSLLGLARTAIKAETTTEAGRFNLVGLVGVFLLTLLATVPDLVQVIVRIWDGGYETGTPSAYSWIRVYVVGLVCCVGLLGLVGAIGGRGTRDR